jgi:hypothetical protein
VALERSIGGPSEPVRPDTEGRVVHEEVRTTRSSIVAHGTLACPSCDAPVALGGERVSPPDPLSCPFCEHHGAARDFLSLRAPTRPARVAVRVFMQRR